MVNWLWKLLFPVVFGVSLIVFYLPLITSGKIPTAFDTIVGLYHPYRDFYQKEYPRGIPFKNFLITDPVRQTYIWKDLSIKILKDKEIPSWNPYEMAGKPLAANFQSAAFYPLNVLMFFNFTFGWSFLIVSQSVLTGIFAYLYLKNLKLHQASATLGSIAFSYSGVVVSWLTWGTIVHTFMWLPLCLYAVDKLLVTRNIKFLFLLFLALTFSILAGHPQSLLYLVIVTNAYFFLRFVENGKKIKSLFQFYIAVLLSLAITSFQWVSLLNFLNLSARLSDRQFNQIEGWFLPWQNLVQFVSPDFFGNPATLNYSGVFNYAEFVGYIGVIPLIFAFFSLIKINRTIIFFGLCLLVSLIFALPTGISSLPYALNIPLFSSLQPSRLILIVGFSLSVMSAFGMNHLIKKTINMKHLLFLLPLVTIFSVLWILMLSPQFLGMIVEQKQIAARNLILPSALFGIACFLMFFFVFFKNKKVRSFILIILVVATVFDVLRFAQKFTPFTDSSYAYPNTKALEFLKSQKGQFRVANLDRRIMAPNFFTFYRIQTIEGYDPLYLDSYAQYIASMERGKPDASKPYGFNRIITPQRYESELFDFLNVKYVLSLSEINSPKLKKVYEEGETKIYENINVYPRAFFVSSVTPSKNSIAQINEVDLKKVAVVDDIQADMDYSYGEVVTTEYSENSVKIATYNKGNGFMVLSDTFYPTWKATIDKVPVKIYRTNHAFRGIFVPRGNHTIIFENSLF